MRFRPCIDLHQGKVKQIVGSTLESGDLITNFVSSHSPAWYAKLYRDHQLQGGHIIQLGPGNETSALEALKAFPNGFRFGGGIHLTNAEYWLKNGAQAVIISSYMFTGQKIDRQKLKSMKEAVGKEKLVIDLSCGQNEKGEFLIYSQGWRLQSKEVLSPFLMEELMEFCDGFLIHSVDREGKCEGLDEKLVAILSAAKQGLITYAGGIASQKDLELLNSLSHGKIDFTIGSALDIFGGKGFSFGYLVKKYGSERMG